MSPPHRPQLSPARRAVVAELDAPARRRQFSPNDGAESPRRFSGLPPQERAFAERLHRGVLQNVRLLDWLIAGGATIDPERTVPQVAWILRVAIYQRIFLGGVPDYAIGQQAVDHAHEIAGPKAAGFVNALIRALMDKLPNTVEGLEAYLAEAFPGGIDPALRYSVPDAIVEQLAEGYGADAMPGLLKSFSEAETRVWLRVNSLKTTRDALVARLANEGVGTETSPFAENVLRWTPTDRLDVAPWRSQAWKEGECTVQDLGAMLAVWAMAPKRGETVIDWCAAPGGKTGQIWESMVGQGNLLAYEMDYNRREALQHTLERLYGGYHSVKIPVKGGDMTRLMTSRNKLAHAILIDAPCMGFGLLRRHPEIRWDDRLSQAEELHKTHLDILTEASQYLAPGGRLVWVTCSPTKSENESLISEWLQDHQDFRLASPPSNLPETVTPWVQVSGSFLRTRPDLAPVDGFSVGMLSKKA